MIIFLKYITCASELSRYFSKLIIKISFISEDVLAIKGKSSASVKSILLENIKPKIVIVLLLLTIYNISVFFPHILPTWRYLKWWQDILLLQPCFSLPNLYNYRGQCLMPGRFNFSPSHLPTLFALSSDLRTVHQSHPETSALTRFYFLNY